MGSAVTMHIPAILRYDLQTADSRPGELLISRLQAYWDAAANAPAINFTNSAGAASFTEVDATGGTSGIIWTNSSVLDATLAVTGTGHDRLHVGRQLHRRRHPEHHRTPASPVSNLNATAATSLALTNVFVQNTGGEGIAANTVDGVILTNLRVHGAGDGNDENGIELVNVTGTGGLQTSNVTQSAESNIAIDNTSGSLTFEVAGNNIADTAPEAFGNDGIQVLGTNAANITLNVTDGNTFSNNKSDHIQTSPSAAATGTYVTTIDGNTFTSSSASVLGGGLVLGGSGSSQSTIRVLNNAITEAVQASVNVISFGTAAQQMDVTIHNNDIGTAAVSASGGSQGIWIEGENASTIRARVTDNVIHNWDNPGGAIRILSADASGGSLNATITGNTIATPGPQAGHGIIVDQALDTDNKPICVDIGGAGALANNVQAAEGNPAFGSDIRVRQIGLAPIRLRGYTRQRRTPPP